MAIPIFIHVVENPPLVLSDKEHGEVMASVYGAMAHEWTTTMLGRHFDRDAHDRYGYQQRSRGWQLRKVRAFALGRAEGTQDLVYTGRMRRMVLGFQKITADATKAVVRIFGPRYLWQYNKQVGAPDKAAEILKVTDDENRTFEQVGAQTYEHERQTRTFAPVQYTVTP